MSQVNHQQIQQIGPSQPERKVGKNNRASNQRKQPNKSRKNNSGKNNSKKNNSKITVGTIPIKMKVSNRSTSAVSNRQIASSIVKSFHAMLNGNPELRKQFVKVYNNGETKFLTNQNEQTVMTVAEESYKTQETGIDQSKNYSIERFVSNIRLIFFNAFTLSYPPLKTTSENAFYTNFLMMMYVLTPASRLVYNDVIKQLHITDSLTVSDFDVLNKKYILNTNYLILYVIHLMRFNDQLEDYRKTVMQKFITNLDDIIKIINSSLDNVKSGVTNRYRKQEVVKFINLYFGNSDGKNKIKELINSTDTKSITFSQRFYLAYTLGYTLNQIKKLSTSAYKQILSSEPIEDSDIFARELKPESTTPVTKCDVLQNIYILYNRTRTKLISFMTSASRLCDIVPREIYREIDLKKLKNKDAKTVSEFYSTFWFNYSNRSRFLKEMTLRTGTAKDSNTCPTICEYYSHAQNYVLRIPSNDRSAILIYGSENSAQDRKRITQAFGQVGDNEMELILYMLFKNNKLRYVEDKVVYNPEDNLTQIINTFNVNTGAGLFIEEVKNNSKSEKSYKVDMEIKSLNNEIYNRGNNTNNINNVYNQSSKTKNQNQNQNQNKKSGQPNSNLNKIIKRESINKNKDVKSSSLPIEVNSFVPLASNGYKEFEIIMSGKADIIVSRIYLDSEQPRNLKSTAKTLDSRQVEGWKVTINGVDVGIIEHVKLAKGAKFNKEDFVFNITVLAMEDKPSLGLIITPTVLMIASILSNKYYKLFKDTGSIFKKLGANAQVKIKALREHYLKSHKFQSTMKTSAMALMDLTLFEPTLRILC